MSETGELVLPDGRRIGTRGMRRYYKQRYRPEDDRASTQSALTVAIQRMNLLLEYEGAGIEGAGQSPIGNTRALAIAVAKGRGGKAGGLMAEQKTRGQAAFNQYYKDRYWMKLGVKANKLSMVNLKING